MTSGSITCPFCGEVMDSPLRFCVACGRAITQDDLKRAGLKIQKGRGDANLSRADVSRGDFSFHRKVRAVMYSTSAVIALIMGYYVVMKHVLHEHIPGNLDLKIEQLVSGQSGGNGGQDAASQVPTDSSSK